MIIVAGSEIADLIPLIPSCNFIGQLSVDQICHHLPFGVCAPVCLELAVQICMCVLMLILSGGDGACTCVRLLRPDCIRPQPSRWLSLPFYMHMKATVLSPLSWSRPGGLGGGNLAISTADTAWTSSPTRFFIPLNVLHNNSELPLLKIPLLIIINIYI